MRIGTAIDVHGFSESGTLKLGLLEFEDLPSLEGDSDADVAAHAVCDALLLAAGLPDLGGTISRANTIAKGRMKDEDGNLISEKILTYVLKEVRAEAVTPDSVSVQIVTKKPRLVEHLPIMRQVFTDLLGCPVNVSATTTDGYIPDIGDGKAIMAIATALLRPF